LAFTAFLLEIQHKKGIVWRSQPASSLVASLSKALNGMPLSLVRLVVAGGSFSKTEKVPSLFPDRGTLTNK